MLYKVKRPLVIGQTVAYQPGSYIWLTDDTARIMLELKSIVIAEDVNLDEVTSFPQSETLASDEVNTAQEFLSIDDYSELAEALSLEIETLVSWRGLLLELLKTPPVNKSCGC